MVETPEYIQYASQLRKNILSGMYGWKGGLPGIQELKRQSGLAANTIYRALALLVGEKLIEQRDKAYYVCHLPYPMTQYVLPVDLRMKVQERNGYIRNVGKVERITLPEHLADKAKLGKVNTVLQACVLGELVEREERPMQFSHYYFTLPVSNELVDRMQTDATADPLTESNMVGKLTRNDELAPRLPTQEEAKILDISNNTPVQACMSIVRDENGNVLLIQEDVCSPRMVFIYAYQFTNQPEPSN